MKRSHDHTSRPRRVLTTAPTLLLMALLLSGCATLRAFNQADAERESTFTPSEVTVINDYLFSFETLQDYVSKPDLVVLGEVVDEKRGTLHGEKITLADGTVEDDQERDRILTIRVDEVFAGSYSEDTLQVRTLGWFIVDGQEIPGVEQDAIRMNSGDRAIMALNRDCTFEGRPYNFSNALSVYLLDNGEIVDTARRAPIVERLEKLTSEELLARVRERAQSRTAAVASRQVVEGGCGDVSGSPSESAVE